MIERFHSLFERDVNVRSVALLRLIVGPLALIHLWEFWGAAAEGHYFADGFFVPFFEVWPVPTLTTYKVLLALGLLGAGLLSIGLLTRLAAATTLAVVAYNVLCNQLHFHHNRAFLMTLLFGLTLVPSGRALSVDAWRARRRGEALSELAPAWQLMLFRALACVPYLASGISKLFDPDWFGGIVMRDRILRYRHLAEAKGVPPGVIDFVAEPALNAVMWKLVVLTEIFVGIGLWFPRTHTVAIFMALGFHLLIELTSKVQLFSFLGIAATLIWVTPSARDRVIEVAKDSRLARWTRRLDWLARFQLKDGAHNPRLVDRGGEVLVGRSATLYAFSRFPLMAPVMLPIWWLHRFRTRDRPH